MAIDTKEKRQTIFSVGRVWNRNTFPVATPDEQWRLSVGNAYGGNALTPPAPAEGQPQYPSGWLFHDNC